LASALSGAKDVEGRNPQERMDWEYDDNKADFKLDGPFAALKVRF
jgi:hypothetical protein